MVQSDTEVIKRFIDNKQENEYVDFKLKTYGKDLANSELVKDVVAFANGEAKGDKYIIFGVADETKEIVGIPDTEKFEPSVLENSLDGRVEPRVKIECGEIQIDGKRVAYIKIPEKNDNPPYIIKKAGGKNQSIREGDILVRIGTSNRKANREDLDRMYRGSKKMSIKMYDRMFHVGPIPFGKRDKDRIEEGVFEIELINPTSEARILCGGMITISNSYGTIERNIWGVDKLKRFEDSPYTLEHNSRKVEKMYFDFRREDCVCLRFADTGVLGHSPRIMIELFDTDENVYYTEIEQPIFLVHRDMLDLLEKVYEGFRKKLMEHKELMIELIRNKRNDEFEKLLVNPWLDFSFVQPDYVLSDVLYPEYDILYIVVNTAFENKNEEALEIMRKNKLDETFIEFCRNWEKEERGDCCIF